MLRRKGLGWRGFMAKLPGQLRNVRASLVCNGLSQLMAGMGISLPTKLLSFEGGACNIGKRAK